MLTAVFDRIIEAVTGPLEPAGTALEPLAEPGRRPLFLPWCFGYAEVVASRRRLMAVFIREVHNLPPERRERLRRRQRALVGRWRGLLADAHPDWSAEHVRTAVHGAFGLLNTVGTFDSPLSDGDLARQLAGLACGSLALPTPPVDDGGYSDRYRLIPAA